MVGELDVRQHDGCETTAVCTRYRWHGKARSVSLSLSLSYVVYLDVLGVRPSQSSSTEWNIRLVYPSACQFNFPQYPNKQTANAFARLQRPKCWWQQMKQTTSDNNRPNDIHHRMKVSVGRAAEVSATGSLFVPPRPSWSPARMTRGRGSRGAGDPNQRRGTTAEH